MRKSLAQSFTLVELLVVMGVLAVLVVTILVSLNPSEAQKKSRDTKRMKDLRTLEAIILQYIQDGRPPILTSGCPHTQPRGTPSGGTITVCTTVDIINTQSQSCSSNWLGVDLCSYTNTVPLDPINARSCNHIYGNVSDPQTQFTAECYYTFVQVGSDYKITALQESKSNINNVAQDGGTDVHWAEVGSNLQLW